jgi:hypothetical protein
MTRPRRLDSDHVAALLKAVSIASTAAPDGWARTSDVMDQYRHTEIVRDGRHRPPKGHLTERAARYYLGLMIEEGKIDGEVRSLGAGGRTTYWRPV